MVLYSASCDQQDQAFSGVLELVSAENINIKSRKRGEKVLVVVYKTSINHFAVIYPFWGMEVSRKPICSINLNSTRVEKSPLNPDREFSIVSIREGVSFLFRTIDLIGKSLKEKYSSDDWIQALSNTNKISAFVKSTYKSRSNPPLNLSVLNEDSEEND